MDDHDTGSDGGGVFQGSDRRTEQPVSRVISMLRENSLVTWLLIRGERTSVVVALLIGVFLTLLGFALLRPFNMQYVLADTSALRTLFAALLSGAILIVSVVSSISSIVLSQEISDIETEQERIDAAIEFRRRTEDMADLEGSPSQPAAFLEVILYTIYQETRDLWAAAERSDNRAFDEQIDALAEEIITEAKAAATTLDGAQFGTFKVLSAGLNYDYSWQLNRARRIQNRYDDDLSTAESDALSNLIDTLQFFATGREYFQSLYYKREVARLSSMLLYVSLPVIVYISYLLLALDTAFIPDLSVGPLSAMSTFVIASYTVSLAPYVVLTAYVIRVGAITIQTLAAGPFTVQQPDHDDVVELQMDADPSQWLTGSPADDPDQGDDTAKETS